LTPLSVLRRTGVNPNAPQPLPWTVSYTRTVDDYLDALELRATSYGRRLGGSILDYMDDEDFLPGAFVMIAREKATSTLLGCVRVAFGRGKEIGTLSLDPRLEGLASQRLCEARRLCIPASGSRTLVKISLWKSLWKSACRRQTQTLLISARAPLNDDYRGLQFQEAIPGGLWVTPHYAIDPHEVLMAETAGLEECYRTALPELHHFMDLLQHPDIGVIPDGTINPLCGSRASARVALSARLRTVALSAWA
jgi:hypothetical protein